MQLNEKLVCPNKNFYFLRRNNVAQHCRIKTKQVDGETTFSLGENDSFVNLYSLVDFYRSHPLRTPQFEIALTEAIAQVGPRTLLKQNIRLVYNFPAIFCFSML